MTPELKEALQQHRKKQRDLAELKQMRERMRELKNPDAKLLKQIEEEIAKLQG